MPLININNGDSGLTARNKINNAFAKVDVNEGDISQLMNDLAGATASIFTIENDITTIQGDITTIEGDITTIQGDITTIEGDITTIQNDIIGITSSMVTPDIEAVLQEGNNANNEKLILNNHEVSNIPMNNITSSTVTIDMQAGNIQKINVDDDCNITLSNRVEKILTLILVFDGSRTVSLNQVNHDWIASSATLVDNEDGVFVATILWDDTLNRAIIAKTERLDYV